MFSYFTRCIRHPVPCPRRTISLSSSRLQKAHDPRGTNDTHGTVRKTRPSNSDKMVIQSPDTKLSYYPILDQLGITTEGTEHRLTFSSDLILRYIFMGLVNKNIAVQYCHYLAELTRTSSIEHQQYFANRTIRLLAYLMKNGNPLPPISLNKLYSDIADSDSSCCSIVCDKLMNQDDVRLNPPEYSRLLAACYKFGLWTEADLLMKKYSGQVVFFKSLVEDMILAIERSASNYQGATIGSKKKLREDVFNHFYNFIELCYRDRLQLITKYKKQFREALKNFDIEVFINPVMKQSGRCTHCQSKLPVYDPGSTSILNQTIRKVLETRELNLEIFAESNELKRFETYLESIYKEDNKPIDCVIDGMNVAYHHHKGSMISKKVVSENLEVTKLGINSSVKAQVLINVILRGEFLGRFKKVLLIGNESKDDLFQLYAATLNPKTLLVTNDFLRENLILLVNDKDRFRLERWIDTHQTWIERSTLTPIWPTSYEKLPSVDRSENHFHLPIIDFDQLETIGSKHAPPPHLNLKMTSWFCCKFKNIDEVSE